MHIDAYQDGDADVVQLQTQNRAARVDVNRVSQPHDHRRPEGHRRSQQHQHDSPRGNGNEVDDDVSVYRHSMQQTEEQLNVEAEWRRQRMEDGGNDRLKRNIPDEQGPQVSSQWKCHVQAMDISNVTRVELCVS